MFWSVFSLQVGHCVYWLYIIILIIIIIVVVYDYYYLSSLLAEDWHFEICLSLDAVAEKNKLLLLILFHKSLDSEIFCPHFSSFSLLLFLFVHLWMDFGFLYLFLLFFFFFWWSGSEATCLESFSTWGFNGGPSEGLLYTPVVTSLSCTGPVWQRCWKRS